MDKKYITEKVKEIDIKLNEYAKGLSNLSDKLKENKTVDYSPLIEEIEIVSRAILKQSQTFCDFALAQNGNPEKDELEDLLYSDFWKLKAYLSAKSTDYKAFSNHKDYIKTIIDLGNKKEPFLMGHGVIDLDNLYYTEISEDYINNVEEIESLMFQRNRYLYELLDTDWIQMDGDIIITDPCYLINDDVHERDEHFDELYKIIDQCGMRHNTLYGDWSCTTYNSDTKEIIGRFCADTGEVMVLPLEAIKSFSPANKFLEEDMKNPKYDRAYTLVKGFHGKIMLKIEQDGPNGFCLHVIGKGNINFMTKQTGY